MDTEQIVRQAQTVCGRMADALDIRALATVAELADYGPHLLRSLLKHELVCDHTVKMRIAAKVDHFLGLVAADRSAEDQDRGCRQATRLAGTSARLSGQFRQGLAALAKLDRQAEAESRRRRKAEDRELGLDEGADDGDDDHPGGGPGGGKRMSPAKLLAQMQALRKAAEAKLNGTPKPNGNGSHACPRESGDGAAPGQRRGTLRHGNPSGDFLSAPRCGAKCRSGQACRQPAMMNGRCRLHGGKSTGARTPEGLARCRTATLVHGARTAEIIDLQSAAARHARNTRILVQAVRHHLQSDRPTPCPATNDHGRAQRTSTGTPPSEHPSPSLFIRGHLRSSAVSFLPTHAPDPGSERPTPCPARAGAGQPPVDARWGRAYIDAPFPKRRIAFG